MQPPPLSPKPVRRMPFSDLPALSQREAMYLWGISATLFAVLFAVLFGVPLVVFVLWPIFTRWGAPILLSSLVLTFFFVLGYFFGGWTGTMAVLDLGKSPIMDRLRRTQRRKKEKV